MNFAVSGKSDSIGYFKQKVNMIEILESKRPLLAIVCRNERTWYSGVRRTEEHVTVYRILCTVKYTVRYLPVGIFVYGAHDPHRVKVEDD